MVTTLVVDTFHRGLGLAPPVLPRAADDAAPRRRRPGSARKHRHWMQVLAPDDVRPGELDPYTENRDANIHRAMNLVPEEVVGFFDFAHALYLSSAQMTNLGTEPRVIDRAQIELLAARVSALNQCVY